MTDIDASVKTDSLKYIDRAISYAELAFSTNSKASELSQLIQTAPERLKILQAELKKPFMAPEKVEARAQQMRTVKLEQRLRQKEAELATAENRMREWSDRLTAEKNIINQTTELVATATSRLKDIQTELEKITREETVLAGKYEGYQSRLKGLEEEFKTSKKRVERYN